MFKLKFAFMLNLIELEHKQTTPKTLNQPENKNKLLESMETQQELQIATMKKVEKTKGQSYPNKLHKMSVKTLRFNKK